MEDLFEFLFGASGRISRAKYWRSVLIYIGGALMTAVILFTAAGIAAPLFVLMVVVVLIPWLLWGSSFTQAAARPRQERVVARDVLSGAGRARPICKHCMVWRSRRHGAAVQPGAGVLRVDDLGIRRDRLPARYRRTEHLRA